MIKRISFFIVLVSFTLTGLSQEYKIDVEIKGLENQALNLGHYYGDKQYLVDTIQLDDHGKGSFVNHEKFKQGIYLIITEKRQYFEILVGDDQVFSLKTDTSHYINNLEFKGSTINTAFIDYQKHMIGLNTKAHELRSRMGSTDDENVKQEIQSELKEVNSSARNYIKQKADEYPNTLLSVILNGMTNPEIPEFDVPDDVKNKDSVIWFKTYAYNVDHFFDNFDLSDERLIRTPLFHNKIEHYFKRILMQIPDTIIKYGEQVIGKTKYNDEPYEYVVRYLLNNYQGTKIMGMDKVFVHIAEEHILKGDNNDWFTDQTMKNIREKVIKTKPNLIGEVAPNLIMETPTGAYERLHDVNAKYILLYFWEPGCGHCKTVSPKLYDLYLQYDPSDFQVFAVYTQADKDEWVNYLEEKGFDWINVYDPHGTSRFRLFYDIYSTPTMYLLNKDKEIIAKRFAFENLKEMLERELGK